VDDRDKSASVWVGATPRRSTSSLDLTARLTMSTHSYKYNLAMAGEFFVAAQLLRLGVSASVTYGNAKRADVVVINKASGKAVLIEVKCSSSGRWPVGSRVPQPSPQPWVFVHLPKDTTEAPEYFIVTQTQLHSALLPVEQAYMAKFKAKHGVEYGDKPGVAAASRTDLASYKDAWPTILDSL
jgi:hypothetical protein